MEINSGKSFPAFEKWKLYWNILQDHDGLAERWKRKDMENLLELHNKTPVWNDGKTHIYK